MEQQNSEHLSQSNNNFLTDFDLEEINFSALDKGLGFHHKNKELKENQGSSTFQLKNKTLRTTKAIKEVGIPSLKTDQSLGRSEISIDEAYGLNTEDNLNESIDEHRGEVNHVESSLEKVTAAWAVDLVLILLSIISALILFTSSTGIGFDEFRGFMLKAESQIFIGLFFTIFYLLYFSVLDLNSSPGKLLFGTKLVTTSGSRLTVFNTFARAFIILISIPLFLLPLIFGLHNKLSGTQSVEEKW